VKLTVGIKLKPTKEQIGALRETLRRANEAANEISRVAWEQKVFSQFGLQKLTYKAIRERFGLSAQIVVRVTAKVADAYKLDKRKQRVFRADGSIAFDDRILRYGTDYVSIWTLAGRERIPFVCGAHQRRLLHARQGESDLVFRKGKWYLFATANVIEPLPDEDPEGWLGVDFGIARIASDSEGQSFSGAQVRNMRKRHRRLRAKLQAKGTRSAKRLLKKRALKERRFVADTNHRISKTIVDKAQRTKKALVLEDLKGLRLRVRASRRVRAELHSWSFAQLRAFIQYKAVLAGVKVIVVDARNTSRQCSRCGDTAKANRRSQFEFKCRSCGHTRNADINAALNIRSRGAVIRPDAAPTGEAASPSL
jgi:IS605 OrfB family transposase